MTTTYAILRSLAARTSHRTTASGLLPLGLILSTAWLSVGQQPPADRTTRMATDPASGSLAVELFRTAGKPSAGSTGTQARGEAAIRPTLGLITGAVCADIRARLDAVHALGRGLSREEVTVLCQFVKSPADAQDKDLPGLEALKNDILNVLRGQTLPPPDFTGTLVAIYHDPGQDSVIRDYAIQHLVAWHEQGAPDKPDARDRIRAVLFEAAGEYKATAGTALLGLHLLSADDTAFCQEDISRLALRLVCSAQNQVAARVTAVQVCAERGIKEALPTIQSLAEAASCVPLRLAAGAALARLSAGQQTRLGPGETDAAPIFLRVASLHPE